MSDKNVCSVCSWTNVSLLNLGEPGQYRLVCHGCCKRIIEERDLLKEGTAGLVTSLKDSTDRLHAIWCNTGSIGARNQVNYNMIALKCIDPNYKPNGSNRPNRSGDKEIQDERR